MVHQNRYPNIVTQEKGTESNGVWNDLDNIKIDNWESLASCNVKGEIAPSVIVLEDFNFNIPKDVQLSQIAVFHDFKCETSQTPIKIEPPIFELIIGDISLKKESHISADIYSAERIITFDKKSLEDVNVENIKDLKVKVYFPKNKTNNEGLLFLDYISLRIDYEEKRYLITDGEGTTSFPDKDNPIHKAVGDTLAFTVAFRNVTGVTTDKQEIQLSIPDGFEVDKYYFRSIKLNSLYDEADDDAVDKFDKETNIWYCSVRGKGGAALKLILKCVKEGSYALNAYNKNAGNASNFHVEIHDENYKSYKSLFEENSDTWAEELKDDPDFVLMNKQLAVSVENVSMEFEMAAERIDNLKEYVIRWIKRDIPKKSHFNALGNVNFKINKGERVGIIGFNGAGKSTLLKILSGVLKPTTGSVNTYGKIAPLLELGAGFDHNYSGRENIFLNGAILGYSKEFLESKYDEIVEFSELEEFIDIPLKNYSSGMSAKLGFSVATIVEPDILILDEVLSVGDVKFQKKSGDKLKSMMGSGVTVLLVSHSVASIRELCTRAIWLKDGEVFMDGDVDYVCDAYIEAADKASEEELANLELD